MKRVIATSMNFTPFFCLFLWTSRITFAQQNVSLTSTLPDSNIVLPEQEIVFTCIARGAEILQWSSDQYISSDGHNIQIFNSASGRDVTRGNTRATLVSATVENGIQVLVSELHITTSIQYPMAIIKCDDNGHGSKDNITFVLQNITLTSALTGGNVAYSGQELVFTCIARGAEILQWSSDQYISNGGHNIQIFNSASGRDVTRGNARATLVSATMENGIQVLVSELRFVVSSQYSMATIKCDDNGHGSEDSITFHLTDPPHPRINSTLRRRMFACPGENVRFECVTTDSQDLAWISDVYIGAGAALHFSRTSPKNVPEESSGIYYAMLLNNSMDTGRITIASLLNITVLESIKDQPHSVTCLNVDVGTNTTISFQLADSCEDSATTSVSTNSGAKSEKNSNSLTTILLVVIISIAVIAISSIIIALCVLKAIHRGKRNSVNPCSCIDSQAESQHPIQSSSEQLKSATANSVESEQEHRRVFPTLNTIVLSSQGNQMPVIMTELVEEDNTSARAASCTDIHMQDNSSAGSGSNKDVPLQESTHE